MLSLYKISVKVRKRLDSVRCQFLWQGISTKRKFASVQCKMVCMQKELGGMEVMNLHYMNISLLLKCWWKLKDT
jgi:hypothetical protein